MLSFFLKFFQFSVKSSFSLFEIVLFDLQLGFTLSSKMTFRSLTFGRFDFDLNDFLSHEVTTKQVLHDTKTWRVTSGQKTFSVSQPSQFNLNLRNIILSSRSKDLNNHSKPINDSYLPHTIVIIACHIR